MKRIITLPVLIIALLSSATANADRLDIADVLPAELIKSHHYKIETPVNSDGVINMYRLETKYGRMTIEGTPLLLVRAHELNALAAMQHLEESDIFKQALEKSASNPLKGAAALVEAPIPTLKSAATGIGRWFGDVGRAIVSDDPHQSNVAKTALGQSTAKRAFAYQFGVDPYSSFKPLQEKLENLAWAAAGGGLTIKAAFSMIPDVVGTVVSVTGTTEGMRSLVRDSSPAQLEDINRKKLNAMKVSANISEALLNNSAYTPQERTILIGEVDSMKSIHGRKIFIAAASRADGEAKAVFMRYRAQMIARYLLQTKAKGRFVEVDNTIFLKTARGEIVGHFPIDSIEEVDDFAGKLARFDDAISKQSGVKQKIMFVGGSVAPLVRDAMKKSGWEVVEHEFRK